MTAAMSKKIKRILTEVLLKVAPASMIINYEYSWKCINIIFRQFTDELFEEIASKVLGEDDISSEGYLTTPPSSPEILVDTVLNLSRDGVV